MSAAVRSKREFSEVGLPQIVNVQALVFFMIRFLSSLGNFSIA